MSAMFSDVQRHEADCHGVIGNVTADEFVKYVDVIGLKTRSGNKAHQSPRDIVTFLKGASERMPAGLSRLTKTHIL